MPDIDTEQESGAQRPGDGFFERHPELEGVEAMDDGQRIQVFQQVLDELRHALDDNAE